MSSTVLLPLRASTLRRTKSRAPSRVVRAAGVGETRVFRGIDPRQLVAPTIGHTVLVTGGTSESVGSRRGSSTKRDAG